MIIGDINASGYFRVTLYNKNNSPKKQRFFRHRLVAKHFLPNPQNFKEVNHKDGNKNNNNVSNLEWCSRIENERHCRKIIGTKEYKPFKVVYSNGETEVFDVKEELAKKLNLTKSTIKNWLHKKSKGYLQYEINDIFYI